MNSWALQGGFRLRSSTFITSFIDRAIVTDHASRHVWQASTDGPIVGDRMLRDARAKPRNNHLPIENRDRCIVGEALPGVHATAPGTDQRYAIEHGRWSWAFIAISGGGTDATRVSVDTPTVRTGAL